MKTLFISLVKLFEIVKSKFLISQKTQFNFIMFFFAMLILSTACSKDDDTGNLESEVNTAPVPVADYDTTTEDATIIVNVLSNDTDANDDTLTLVAVITTEITAAIGTVDFSSNGEITYVPAEDFSGTLTIPYVVTDGEDTATAELVILVYDVLAVKTFAGTGSSGSANGNLTTASFDKPTGIIIDSNGNFFIADKDNFKIRKITPEGVVSTFINSGIAGNIFGMAIDDDDNLYVANLDNILKITPEGVVSIFSSTGGGYIDVAIDSNNNLYVFNRISRKILQITPEGVESEYYSGDELSLVNINGLICDKNDNLYLSGQNKKIYKYSTAKELSVYAENDTNYSLLGSANGMVFDQVGNLYIAGNSSNLIHKVTAEGVLSTFAGSTFGSTNGFVLSASFNAPNDLIIDSSGVIYVTDTNNDLIRKIE